MSYSQVPRFNSLKTLLCRVLQHFLTLDVSLAETETVGGYENPLTKKEVILKQRMTSLDDYVLHFFMRNSTDKTRLIECGYSSRLWNEV